MKFTTSWDDGTVSDLRIAELLERFQCTGTFYVCPALQSCYNERLLDQNEIRNLGQKHEVGAHTMTHPHLLRMSDKQVRRELNGSKKWVEETTGRPCTMFCYPFGEQDAHTQRIVSEIGFRGARTVTQWQFATENPFALGTSLHLYPFPLRPILNRRIVDPLRKAWKPLRSHRISLTAMRSFLSMAKALFRAALRENQHWFHLFGHGWEIEKYGMWSELEDFLEFVKKHKDVECILNSALL